MGARPNFMKIAPLLAELEARGHECPLVHTGQHYDPQMSAAFFDELRIRSPDFHLGVGSGTQAEQLSRVVLAFEPVLRTVRPDWVVVVGDVTSGLAAALVAVKLKGELGCMVAHVEAGLRSRDWTMPEEINRVVTDRISDLLLTPSRDADVNLAAEGIPPERITFVGNIMIDTLMAQLPAARAMRMSATLGIDGQFALVTMHRPSNVDAPANLKLILRCLRAVASRMPVIFPMHPRTRKRISEAGLDDSLSGIEVLEPLSYGQMLSLSDSAAIVLTDSGGLQEETTVLGVPCITLREHTERPITVTHGTNRLVTWPPEPNAVLQLVVEMTVGRPRTTTQPPEGWDGKAATRIVAAMSKHFEHPNS